MSFTLFLLGREYSVDKHFTSIGYVVVAVHLPSVETWQHSPPQVL